MPESTDQKRATDLTEMAGLELLNRVRRGDRAAFSELYKRYQPRLFGYLLRILTNPATVEEVLDDVMFVVWKDARKFKGKAAVSTWIFGIAYRKALTKIRSDRRYQSGLDRNIKVDAVAAKLAPHAEWIEVGLRHLSPEHRQVMELTYFGGFSYQEIAEIADCPVNTVKTRMFHARRRLKILLPKLAGQSQEQVHENT